MENKRIYSLVPGETTLENFFVTLRNTVFAFCNKRWTVVLPAGKGTGTVKESDQQITIDLSQAKFGGGGGGSFPSVDGNYIVNVTAGVGTYSAMPATEGRWVWTGDEWVDILEELRTVSVFDANGKVATMDVFGTEPDPI